MTDLVVNQLVVRVVADQLSCFALSALQKSPEANGILVTDTENLFIAISL